MEQGVVQNFKAYCPIAQATHEKTGGEDKQSIRQFWKDYNILKSINNTRSACN